MFDWWRDFLDTLPPFAQLVIGVTMLVLGVSLLLNLLGFTSVSEKNDRSDLP